MRKTSQKLTTRQRESRKINRKRAVRQWWKVTFRRCMLAGAAVLALAFAAGSLWLWHSAEKIGQMETAMINDLWQQTAKLGFKVDDVYLEGRKSTPLADITRAMNIKTGAPILALSLSDMRDSLQAIPRVKYAEVARILPNQLHIRIVEREPVAIWQNNGKIHLIDDDGVAMEYGDPTQYKNLLLVVGAGAPQYIHELFETFALEPELYKNVVAALRIGDRRWNVRFKNGVELKLPETNSRQAWQSFAEMEQEDHILERAILSVDMRLPDRVFVKSVPTEITPVKYTSGSEI